MIPILALTLASGPLSATLPDGNVVYLSYVSDAPEKRAWRPDGTRTPPYKAKKGFERSDFWIDNRKPDEVSVLVTLKIQNRPKDIRNPDGSSYRWEPTIKRIGDTSGIYISPVPVSKSQWVSPFNPPIGGAKLLSLDLKVADSKWKTVDSVRFRLGHKLSGGDVVSDPLDVGKLMGPKSKVPYKAFPFHFPMRWKDFDWQLVAYNRAGKFLPNAGSVHLPIGDYESFGGLIKEIARVEFQVRPFHVVHFKGIHPKPTD